MSELPKGWSNPQIGQVITLNGKRKGIDDETECGFVPMALMPTGYRGVVNFETKSWGSCKRGFTQFKNNDVLLAKITPCFENGKGGIVTGLPNGIGAGSTEYFVLRCLEDLIKPEYLHAFVKSKKFMDNCEVHMGGSVGHKRVPKDYLLKYEIPLAPLNEQIRITNKLDSILVKVDKAQARLNKIPAILKRFRQSVLAAATSGELTKSTLTYSEWESVKLIDLVENKPRNGKSPKGVDFDTGVKNLTLSAITPGYFVENKYKFVDLDVPTDSHLWLKNQDILIQRANSIEYVGVSALYEGEDDQYIYPDLIMKCRANYRVLSKYLYYALSSEPVRKYFRDNATGTTGNMPKINQVVVSAAPIHLPLIDEQKIIVDKVERLFEKANKVEKQYLNAKARLDRLTQSTLAKAFQGELVAQDPNDEPAEQLLERILKERLSQQQKAEKPKKITKNRATKAKVADKG